MRVKGLVELNGAVVDFDEEFSLESNVLHDWINNYERSGMGPEVAIGDLLNWEPPIVRVTSVKL